LKKKVYIQVLVPSDGFEFFKKIFNEKIISIPSDGFEYF
jgi:hypothetical protein